MLIEVTIIATCEYCGEKWIVANGCAVPVCYCYGANAARGESDE